MAIFGERRKVAMPKEEKFRLQSFPPKSALCIK